MKRKIVLCALAYLVSVAAVAEPIAVIVNRANPVREMSRAVISDIYRGRLENWESGQTIQAVNLPVESGERASFYGKVLQADPADQFFKPGSPAPFRTVERKSARSVLRFVGRFENSIGYVGASTVDGTVKVVATIE